MGCCSSGQKEELANLGTKVGIPNEELYIRRGESRVLPRGFDQVLSEMSLDIDFLEKPLNSAPFNSTDLAFLESFKAEGKYDDLKIIVASVLLSESHPTDKAKVLFDALKTDNSLTRSQASSLLSMIFDVSCRILPLFSNSHRQVSSYLLEHYLTGLSTAEPIALAKCSKSLMGAQEALSRVEFLTRMTSDSELSSLLSSKTVRMLLWDEYKVLSHGKRRGLPSEQFLNDSVEFEPSEIDLSFQDDMGTSGERFLVEEMNRSAYPMLVRHSLPFASHESPINRPRTTLSIDKAPVISLRKTMRSQARHLTHRERVNGKTVEIPFNSSDNLQKVAQDFALKYKMTVNQRRKLGLRLKEKFSSSIIESNI